MSNNRSYTSMCRVVVFVLCLLPGGMALAVPHLPPPAEPPQDQAIEELYDNEAGLVIFTYSLKKDGVVDYVTGRKVLSWRVNDYGHGVYDIESFPVFYWYDQALWEDREADGLNGNETLYEEDISFDRLRYK
jgi:hypothetical protein